MRGTLYQISLIVLGAASAVLFGIFVYREATPEYRIFQDDYIALEKFRSSYTGEAPPVFKTGVKQVVIEREDHGPPTIDRCTSCHVALEFPHFSPTVIAYDINGKMQLDSQGNPLQVPNEGYVWRKLDEEIAELTDEKVIAQLKAEGNDAVVKERLEKAQKLFNLKIAEVDDRIYDVTKALRMHPLIGKETRPFEFHPVAAYGCVSCHNGNGRGITIDTAHGPVFDGEYGVEDVGPKPTFLEKDPLNDPSISKIFNAKPGEELLFQTTPIFVGALIQAKCIQCHLSSQDALKMSVNSASIVTEHHTRNSNAIQTAFQNSIKSLVSLLQLRNSIKRIGYDKTTELLKERSQDYTLPIDEYDAAATQFKTLKKWETAKGRIGAMRQIEAAIDVQTGDATLSKELEESTKDLNEDSEIEKTIDEFIRNHQDNPGVKGLLFTSAAAWNLEQEMMRHIKDTKISLEQAVQDQQFMTAVKSDIDLLTQGYKNGEELFISQACYACHRIAGFARGGIGPELTREGNSYPWFIKESIVWPQADTPGSTMPNYRLDHEELEDLLTYLLGQTGENKSVSESTYKTFISNWEMGRKLPWEEPIPPAKLHDLRFSMTVFATQGCAACHRLLGFESDVGYSVEKDNPKPAYETLFKEKEWFKKLFPEDVLGSQIVSAIEKNASEIDKRISNDVRKGSLLEEIDEKYPGQIEALYSPFKYAERAKNHHFQERLASEKDSKKKEEIKKELDHWKARIKMVLKIFIQEYGLGRLVGPRPNWSGVYRTDEWLVEHFRNPSSHVPRSIMPIFPFDDSKFYALTYMLDVLGIRNRDAVREIWEHQGFNPEQAFHIHCAQCHGDFRMGNGPVAQWIYPIPKNLRNADFLRNLTKERAVQSITHGVKGTPMPPWGEAPRDKSTADAVPVLNNQEINELVNWLFSELPGSEVIKKSQDVPKWQYLPTDVIEELRREGQKIQGLPEEKNNQEEKHAGYFKMSLSQPFLIAAAPILATEPQEAEINSREGANINVEDIFDVRPSPVPGPEKEGYYIKKKYYTEENIQQGNNFFEVNCAACHGAEADGSGPRADVMAEAKPRMLTNLDWINTRDDLRLLRSIKYGVPGTAMTPWGDFTNSLQRLQLVIFIRSLTEERERQEKLSSAMYQLFDSSQMIIERARIDENKKVIKLQEEYEKAKQSLQEIRDKLKIGQASVEEAAKLYQKELEVLEQLHQQEVVDKQFVKLKEINQKIAALYKDIGQILLARKVDDQIFDDFINIISLNNGTHFKFNNNQIKIQPNQKDENQENELKNKIIKNFDNSIQALNKQKDLLNNKIPSPDTNTKIESLKKEIAVAVKARNSIIFNFEQSNRERRKQEELMKVITKE